MAIPQAARRRRLRPSLAGTSPRRVLAWWAAHAPQRAPARHRAAHWLRRLGLGVCALGITGLAPAGSTVLPGLAGRAASASLQQGADLVTTVDFEGYPPATEITSQYSGITFEYPTAAGFTYGPTPGTGVVRVANGPPVVVASGAHSGSNAGKLVRPGEFSSAGTFAALGNLADSVSVYIGDLNGAIGDHVELDAYDANRNLLGSDAAVTSAGGASTLLSYSTGGAGAIAYVAMYRTDVLDTDEVIDDLSVSVPPGSAPMVGVTAPTLAYELGQGGTRQIVLTVDRLDNASQAAAIAISGVPSGVTATLSANPVAPADTTTTLTLDAGGSAAIGTYPISFSASAAGALSQAAEVVSLSIVAPLELSLPSSLQVGGCSASDATVSAQLAPGVPGPVSFSTAMPPTPGLAGSISPAQVAPSNGLADATLTLTSTGGNGTALLEVTASLPGGASDSAAVSVSQVGPQVSSVDALDVVNGQPVSGLQSDTPRAGQPGTTVEITGHGFCDSAIVAFGNPEATVSATVQHESGNQGPYDYLRVTTPRDATSGPVTVTAGSPPASGTSESSLVVDSYRNVEAFSFPNFLPQLNFGDLTRAFGSSQTYVNVNPCGIFSLGLANCSIPLAPDPVALAWLGIAQAAMQSGTCFGFSLTDQRLLEHQIALDSLPRGAESIFGLDAPAVGTDHTARGTEPVLLQLKADHLMQLSTEFLSAYAKLATAQSIESGNEAVSGIVSEIEDAFSAGHYPLVSLADSGGGGGHVVVAYDLAATGGGGYDVYVYDSNLPFAPSEAGDGAAHAAAVAASVIHLGPDGSWSLASTTEPDGSTPFHGGKAGIVVTDPSVVPVHPTLATLGGAAPGLLFSSAGAPGSSGARRAGAGHVTQVSGPGNRFLYRSDGSLDTDPATRLEAAPFAPLVASGTTVGVAPSLTVLGPSVHEVTVATDGSRRGTTAETLVTGGFAGSVTTTGGSGEAAKDSFSPRAGSVALESHSAQAASLLVERSSSSGWRTVQVAVSGVHDGADSLSLAGSGAVVLTHRGPATTIRLTLSAASVGGLPASFTSGPVVVGPGQTTGISATAWRSLAKSPLAVRVGSRTLRLPNRLGPIRLVSIRRIRVRPVRGRGVQLAVTGNLGPLPAASSARLVLLLHRGRRLVAEHVNTLRSSSRHAFFSAWTLPAARAAGTTLTVLAIASAASGPEGRASATSRSIRVPAKG